MRSNSCPKMGSVMACRFLYASLASGVSIVSAMPAQAAGTVLLLAWSRPQVAASLCTAASRRASQRAVKLASQA